MSRYTALALAVSALLGGVAERRAGAYYGGTIQIPSFLEIPVPAGYGHYCSVEFGFGGGWDARTTTGSGDTLADDPCQQLINLHGSGLFGTGIVRAGLYSVSGSNNAMAHCSGGQTWIARDTGAAALNDVKNWATNAGAKGCVITVAPTALPIFGQPYSTAYNYQFVGPRFTGFNYDLMNQEWSPASFGRPVDPSHATGCEFDRLGYQEGYTGSSGCTDNFSGPAADPARYNGGPEGGANEGANDWSISPNGIDPITINSVAPGVVISAGGRNVTADCNGGCAGAGGCSDTMQQEVFIEHKLGHGFYEERFVSAYHHMAEGLQAYSSQELYQGTVLGVQGSTGCSSGPHLDFMVFRLTNLSGAEWYEFHSYLEDCTNQTCVTGACTNNASCNSGSAGTCFLGGAVAGLCYCPNSGVCASGQTCQPDGTCGGTLTDPHGINGIHGNIDPFGWDAPAQVDPWAWKSISLAQSGFSPFPTNVTAYGAFSIYLWQPNSAPPANGDNPNLHIF